LTFLTRLIELITFKIPYFSIYTATKISRKNQQEIWNKLPFKKLKTYKILPDGNVILASWNNYNTDYNIYHYAIYDRFFTPQLGNIVVDAGAHIGIYALKAANEVGVDGRVIAIEPEEKNYELLTTNIRINKHKNINPIKSALSDFEGKARFFIKAQSVSHSLIGKTWITPIVDSTEVTVTTLDGLLDKLGITKVDILKINVEGAELKLLKGSRKLLEKGKISKIVATTHPPFKQEANKIRRYLEGFGYEVKVADGAQILCAQNSENKKIDAKQNASTSFIE